MKKLLTLMLVLCIASSANALLLGLDPSGAADALPGLYDLDVVSDSDDAPYERFLVISDNTYGDIASIAILGNAGANAKVEDYGAFGGYAGAWLVNAVDMDPEPDPAADVLAGIQFRASVDFTGSAVGQNLLIELVDGNLNVLDSKTYSGIPEPATMLLLGLGGLFLRRRK